MTVEILDGNYKQIIDSEKLVVIDFWANWCGPCKMVSPVIDELAQEYAEQAVIGKCDVDDNSEITEEYGIRNIPTVLFFKDGKLLDKQVGSAPKSTFEEKLKALI